MIIRGRFGEVPEMSVESHPCSPRPKRQKGRHTMVDLCEDEVSVDKWVDETGATVEHEGLGTISL